MKLKLPIVCLLALAVVTICVRGAPTSENEVDVGAEHYRSVRAAFSPTKLFDFDYYKTTFHKTYSGFLEELVRKKYFLSRAFRAFISAIKYKYRKSSFYLAVNEMSDKTKEELAKSENKVLAGPGIETMSKTEERGQGGDESVEDKLAEEFPDILPDDVEEAEEELKKMADSAKPGELGLDESSSSTPAKGQSVKTRDLPIEKLIDTGEEARLSPDAARKLTNDVTSNNPQYEPFELPSSGLKDDVKDITFWMLQAESSKSSSSPANDFSLALEDVKSDLAKHDDHDDDDEEYFDANDQLSDEVFVDLRDTGCLTLPRQQGDCGSCWAFASITIFEYLYCRRSGKLVPFSEQYLLDCGHDMPGFSGCEGGDYITAVKFVKNFGLELRKHYPYSAREDQCPYEESTNLNQTGFIRFDFDDVVEIDIERWDDYIELAPIWAAISLSPGFREYGGGILGWGCSPTRPTHAVVVVGHGVEDGHEYWLIRNSFSVGWGEGGYGKLAKRANCFGLRTGYAAATKNGLDIVYRIKKNRLGDRDAVRKHFLQNMLF